MEGGMRSDVETHDAGTAALAAELGRQTALLEGIHEHGRPLAAAIEDVATFAFTSNQAYSWDPGVPDIASVEVEAWISSYSAVPVVVFDGAYTAAQCLAMIADNTTTGWTPVLFCVPVNGGPVRVERAHYSGSLTVFAMGAPATHSLLCTLRIRARP